MSAVGSGATDASRAYAVWLVDLRKTESPADEWISRGEKIRNDLLCDGTSFVDSINEDLRKSLCTKDILDLTGDIDESKMQILIMLERHIENPAAIGVELGNASGYVL